MKTSDNLFFTNPSYNLYYVNEDNIIIVEAYGTIKPEYGKEAWLKALEKAEEHKITKWVSDEAGITLLHPENTRWWKEVWFPLASKRLRYPGIRLTATILSKRFYAEMGVKEMITQTLEYEAVVGQRNKYLEHLYFQTFEEAYEWISTYTESVI